MNHLFVVNIINMSRDSAKIVYIFLSATARTCCTYVTEIGTALMAQMKTPLYAQTETVYLDNTG